MPARSEWEELYHQALLEVDEDRMAELILKAKQAVHKRLSDIRGNNKVGVQFEERHKLQDALISLECLRRISQGSTK